MSRWTPTTSTVTDELSLSQSFEKQDANYEKNSFKYSIWQITTNQLSQLGSYCSDFSDETLASVQVPQTVSPTS